MKSRRAFTVIELLISVSILAGISTLLWQTYASTFRIQERLSEVNDTVHFGRVVLEKMVRELRMAFYIRTPKPITFFVGSERGESSSMAFTAFGNFPQDAGNNKGDQLKIKYWNEHVAQKKLFSLKKAEQATMDGNPDEVGTTYTLLDNVKTFSIEYHNGDGWKKEWDSRKEENRDRLPKAVRIRFELEDKSGRSYPFQTVAVLPMEPFAPGEAGPRSAPQLAATPTPAPAPGGGQPTPAPPQLGGEGGAP